jgi:hypothetical protein
MRKAARNSAMINRGFLLASASMVPLVAAAAAEGFNYGVDAGIGESDNITLASTNKVSQTLGVADVDFSLLQKGSRLDADVTGSFTYLDFLQHAYGNEILGHFNGTLRYALVPETLTWTLQDNWGQSQVNAFGALTPSNQQNINYLSTGPDWHQRLGGTAYLNVSARYARAQYSVSPFDSNRLQGIVGIGEELSPLSSVSVNGSVERVLFDNQVAAGSPDYDSTSIYGRYELHGARNEVAANLGVDKISAGAESNSGVYAELQFTRKLSQAAKFVVTAGRRLTDASSAFNSVQSAPSVNVVTVNSPATNTPAAVTSGIYTDDYVSGAWFYERNRTTLGFNARWENENYINEPQYNGTRANFGATLERKITQTFTGQIFGNLSQNRYDHDLFNVDSTSYSDDDGLYGATLTLREGRALEVRLRYDHMNRTVSNGVGQGYGENRVFLTIGYRPQQQQ